MGVRGRFTHLVAEEECLELAFGPVVHGISQQLHGEGVHSQEVPNKQHTLNVLYKKQKQKEFILVDITLEFFWALRATLS